LYPESGHQNRHIHPITLAHSSSLTDKEWELLEPFIGDALKTNQTSGLDQTRTSRWSLISTKKMAVTGERLFQRLYRPIQPSIGTSKQWRAAGLIEKLTLLHEATREQVKKKEMEVV
jgi:hypothetical protein